MEFLGLGIRRRLYGRSDGLTKAEEKQRIEPIALGQPPGGLARSTGHQRAQTRQALERVLNGRRMSRALFHGLASEGLAPMRVAPRACGLPPWRGGGGRVEGFNY